MQPHDFSRSSRQLDLLVHGKISVAEGNFFFKLSDSYKHIVIFFLLIKSGLKLKNQLVRYQSCFPLNSLHASDGVQTATWLLWCHSSVAGIINSMGRDLSIIKNVCELYPDRNTISISYLAQVYLYNVVYCQPNRQ